MRRRSKGAQFVIRVGLTLLALFITGYIVSLLRDGNTTPGLSFAVAFGCALGGGLNQLWGGKAELEKDPWWDFLEGFMPWTWMLWPVMILVVLFAEPFR